MRRGYFIGTKHALPSIFKDKKAVYIDSYMADQVVIEGANPESLQLIDIDLGYARSDGKD